MTAARKVKISVSLDADLVEVVDHRAASEGTSRSAVMERWLRQGSQQAKIARLEEETASYYDSLTPAEREDDATWANAATRAARKLRIDEDKPLSPRVTRESRRRPRGR